MSEGVAVGTGEGGVVVLGALRGVHRRGGHGDDRSNIIDNVESELRVGGVGNTTLAESAGAVFRLGGNTK